MPIHPRQIWQPTGVKTMRKLYTKTGFEVTVLAVLATLAITTLGALLHAALHVQVIA
jgi:hypothetical protein